MVRQNLFRIKSIKKIGEVLRKSISIREEIFSKNHSKTWSSVGELAICLLRQKKYTESEKLLNETLEFYKNDKFRDLKKLPGIPNIQPSYIKRLAINH